jgi:HAD superfamily hydrolase (TIGR01509 family)
VIRALLWDHDGVLVDTEELYFQATRDVLASLGLELSVEQHRRVNLEQGRSVWPWVRAQRGYDEAHLEALRRQRDARYAALLAQSDRLVPGVVPLLRALAQTRRMAIVTSSRREHFELLHRDGRILSFFEFVLTREDYGASKPDPEPYRLAVSRLGLAPEACLVIEDSERGLCAARAAGLRCWVLPSSLTRGSAFEGAERVFESFEALSQALLALA